MSDNISRQAAIDAVNGLEYIQDYVKDYVNSAIAQVPSTDRKGEWKEDETGNGFWICSSCGFVSEASGAWLLYIYCPHCEADMRGADDE